MLHKVTNLEFPIAHFPNQLLAYSIKWTSYSMKQHDNQSTAFRHEPVSYNSFRRHELKLLLCETKPPDSLSKVDKGASVLDLTILTTVWKWQDLIRR